MSSRALFRFAAKGQSSILPRLTLARAFPVVQARSDPITPPGYSSHLSDVPIASSRSAATASEKLSGSDAYSLLVAQRKLRPISPHLSIYQPQLTWYGSAANRITGGVLAGGIYAFFVAYLVAPTLGLHLESQAIAAAFGALPVAVKVGIKTFFAAPFSYHSWNGVRHLIWDTGKMLDIRGVYRSGYVVLGLTAVSTVYLVAFA